MDELDYGKKVVKALFYLASQDSEFMIPAPAEAIESEIVNGTISYVGGNAGEYGFTTEDPRVRNQKNELWKYFKRELEDKKLHPKIKDTLIFLLKKESHWSEHFIALNSILRDTKTFSGVPSIHSIPYAAVMEIQREILPSFSDEERKDLEGIANSMKPFMKQDFEYIRKTYSW